MKKRAEIKSREILVIGIISLVLCLTLVYAEIWVGGGGVLTTTSVNENTTALYNITIYNANASNNNNNITMVIINLPEGFLFVANSDNWTNITSGNATFSNTTIGTITTLNWTNATSYGIIANLTNQSFWFNLTSPITPGDYGLNVTGYNSTDVMENQNITITVNDTVEPSTAFASPGVTVNTNLSQNSIPINLSVIDIGTMDTINITLFNSTRNIINSSTNISGVKSWFFNFTNLPNGIYYVNATVNDTFNNINTSITLVIGLDTVLPTSIDFGTGTEDDKTNFSRSNIYINVTQVTELNEKNITFNIYYTNGTLVNATMYTDKTRFINVTGLSDGHYTYNVTVCDFAANCNNTGIRNITLDNVAPVITHLCSPTTLTKSGTVTCTCTAIDATSGLLGSTSFTQYPTVEYGTKTTTCTIGDYAGNNATDTQTYTVSGGAPSSSSGGGSSSITKTYIPTATQVSAGYTKELKSNERVKLTVDSKTHYVAVSSLTTTSATISVSSTPQTATLNIGEEKKFDVTNNDGYYDLSVKLNGIKASKADITIKSIYEKIPSVAPQQSATTAQTPPATTTGELSEEAPKNSTWLWILGIIVVVLIAGIIWYYKNKK